MNIKNIIKDINRFFEPVKKDPMFLLKPILRYIWQWFFVIFSIEVFKRATSIIQKWDFNQLKTVIIAFWLIVIIHMFLWYLARAVSRWYMTFEWLKFFQNLQMRKFFTLDNTTVEKLWTGKLINIIDNGFKMRNDIYIDFTKTIPYVFIIWFYSFYQIAKSWWWISFFIFAITIWLSIFVSYLNNRCTYRRDKRLEFEWEYSRQMIKMIMSKMEIVQNNKIDQEITKTNNILSKATKMNLKVNLFIWAMFESTNRLSHILKIWILVYGAYLLSWWLNDLSQFVWFIAIVWIFEWEMNWFMWFFRQFTNNFAQVKRLWNLYDDTKQMRPSTDKKSFVYKKWDIQIQNITFGYGDNQNIFEKLEIKIEWWKKTSLVWASWAWKTTLLKLIAWFIETSIWDIIIDGQKINEINLNEYYKHIWYLTQDPSVFDGTIYENLVYALDKQPDIKEIEKVTKLSKCDFIREFENWLETEIGERWIRLSWWQKQRLAIAKIMLKNPNIILLDEPTSALDSFNEEQIDIALSNLFESKTVIVVAHRLQTVKKADDIIVFEKWKIVERWKNDELIQKHWIYRKMVELQSWF